MLAARAIGALALLAGCGTAPTAEDRIRAVLDERRDDPPSICDHMTTRLLDSLGGAQACRDLAASDDGRDRGATVGAVAVRGDRATVRITGADGPSTLAFRRVDGEWLLDAGG